MRLVPKTCFTSFVGFQFTHPVWGATRDVDCPDSRGGVSIHAPRVGCDEVAREAEIEEDKEFQFTHPVWGATRAYMQTIYCGQVSIHAPRVGCDVLSAFRTVYSLEFQFTHPVWGATASEAISEAHSQVSIHAPRVGCDET